MTLRPFEVVSEIPAKMEGLNPGSASIRYFSRSWQIKIQDSTCGGGGVEGRRRREERGGGGGGW